MAYPKSKNNLLGLSSLIREAVQHYANPISLTKEWVSEEGEYRFVYRTFFNSFDANPQQEKIKAEFYEKAEGNNPNLKRRVERLQGILSKSYELDSFSTGENGSKRGDIDNKEKEIYPNTTKASVWIIYSN